MKFEASKPRLIDETEGLYSIYVRFKEKVSLDYAQEEVTRALFTTPFRVEETTPDEEGEMVYLGMRGDQGVLIEPKKLMGDLARRTYTITDTNLRLLENISTLLRK
jgi:hypothetical protein